jgi:hypothetical protein
MPHVRSYYAATAHEAPHHPALAGDATFDVCVVGAGIAGSSGNSGAAFATGQAGDPNAARSKAPISTTFKIYTDFFIVPFLHTN